MLKTKCPHHFDKLHKYAVQSNISTYMLLCNTHVCPLSPDGKACCVFISVVKANKYIQLVVWYAGIENTHRKSY